MSGIRSSPGALGEGLAATRVSETLNLGTGSSASTTNLIPAGTLVLCVSTQIIEADTGTAPSANIGDGSDPDRWGAAVDTKTPASTSGPEDFTSATVEWSIGGGDVTLTATSGSFNNGVVSVVVDYLAPVTP